MKMKRFFKAGVIIPIFVGVGAGLPLFMWGEIDDAPGLCLIAVVLCIGLLYLGIRNANKIDPAAKPSIILPLLIGVVDVVCISRYLIVGTYNEPPGLIVVGIIVGIALLTIGFVNIKKMRKRRDSEQNN
jgi:hypothetical protein